MPSLADATQPMDTTNLTLVTSMPARPSASLSASADPEFCPIALAPIPPVMGTDTDAARQFYRNAVSQLRMPPLPAAAKIAQGAQAASQVILSGGGAEGVDLQTNNVDNPVQTKLNLTGAGVTYGPGAGQVSIATGTGDELIHGQGNIDTGSWESDPAYVLMRDDFFSAGSAGGAISTSNPLKIGDLGWSFLSSNGSSFRSTLGAPPNLGTFNWANVGTISEVVGLVLTNGSTDNTSLFYNDNTMPLLEYPNWKASFIWKTDFSTAGTRQHTTTQKAMYVGFVAGDYAGSLAGNISSRPNTFMGIRFDTSTSPGALSVTAVANAAGGTTVYTIPANALSTSNGFVGTTFVTTNCGNTANNGTFICVASGNSSITLLNASGVAGTGLTGFATGPTAPNDSFYTFEVVDNISISSVAFGRNNKQGQTFVTNVAPVAGVWHRLDILCTAAGVVTMTLDGSAINTHTFTVPVQTLTFTSNIATASNSNGSTQISWNGPVSSGGLAHKWGVGSLVTVAGFTSVYNGTFALNTPTGSTQLLYNNASGTGNSNPASSTLSGYPAWIPIFWFGNDDTASPSGNSITFFVDFFSLIWNPAVGGGTATPLLTNPRYFPSVVD